MMIPRPSPAPRPYRRAFVEVLVFEGHFLIFLFYSRETVPDLAAGATRSSSLIPSLPKIQPFDDGRFSAIDLRRVKGCFE